MATNNNITLAQLELALARVKQYNQQTYSELGHTHVVSDVIKLTGLVENNEGNTASMRIAISAEDSLGVALGKLDRSIFNIVENIGAIDVSNHRHDEIYYTEQEIDKKLEDLEKADETLEGDLQLYVQTKIAELIDGAPTTLDTLKEIADSLNNDASLFTTIEGMINDVDAKTVDGPDTSVDGNVVIFDGTNGKKIKDSTFTINKSVPADAIFTDHNVQTVANTSDNIYFAGADVSTGKTGTLLVNEAFYIDATNNTIHAPNFTGHLDGKADAATTSDKASELYNSISVKLGNGEAAEFNGKEKIEIVVTPSAIGAHDAEYTTKATDAEVENMLKTLFPMDV